MVRYLDYINYLLEGRGHDACSNRGKGLLGAMNGLLQILVMNSFNIVQPVLNYRIIDLLIATDSQHIMQVTLGQSVITRSNVLGQCPVFLSVYLFLVYVKVLESKGITVDIDNFEFFTLFNELDDSIELETIANEFGNLKVRHEDIVIPITHYRDLKRVVPKELVGKLSPWLPFLKQKSLVLSTAISANAKNDTHFKLDRFSMLFETLGVVFIDGLIMLMNSQDSSNRYLAYFLQQLVPSLVENVVFKRARENDIYRRIKYRQSKSKNGAIENNVIKNNTDQRAIEYMQLESQVNLFSKHFKSLNEKLCIEVESVKKEVDSTKKKCETILSTQRELIQLIKEEATNSAASSNKQNNLYSLLEGIDIRNKSEQPLGGSESGNNSFQGNTILPSLGYQLSLTSRDKQSQDSETNYSGSAMSVAKTLSSIKCQSNKQFPVSENQPVLLPNLLPTGKYATPQTSEQLMPFSLSPKTFELNTPDTNTILLNSDFDYRPMVRNDSNTFNNTRTMSMTDTPKMKSADEQFIKLPPLGRHAKAYSPYSPSILSTSHNESNLR
ncbi:hypothetical protein TPHA_0L01680 [Tetrapisispora phaffii CBS 4417]|uniref:Uncharacterized protein n=1 Tax=Tetrapisispora phaffii (strain ATCC 24235 / CBS 4417 / NBRC 1672 / NRRL Y-8282 / UCD 70-5) TaxID=1071381 RepID=G8C043_TETPH|nr:hypothetical protein TPHA_0L01680 [Tetrapisispora phaffii CBS 4417]CCE65521.1 hypothetical protein TPHA_0L01680 [Tetrapisispora phaffii CBS 4417]